MKKSNLIILGMVFLSFGCTENYIDEIIPVAQGTDITAPQVTIEFPSEGTLIRVTEDVTAINIKFEVMDDIEVESISLKLNGNEIAKYNDFKDYRRVIKEHLHENLGNGAHTLVVEARDLSGKTTTKTVNFEKVEPYKPMYDGETFYLPFDGDYMELINIKNANVNGNPGFANGLIGRAYDGASNAYLTFPTTNLLSSEFSAVFWYKINAAPDRAGILVIGPPDTNNPNNMNNRSGGFRFFREGSGTNQTFKLNIGNGSGDNWFDGGAAASINPSTNTDWVHLAFTISETNASVYINGQKVSGGDFPGVNWTGCDVLSIASGAPRFAEWGHLSDGSLFDELRLFNKALTQEEIQNIIDAEKP
ncbi:LamG domain-containing protein [Rhodonellum sp.]|uniref:LamG domain-containing protein n=1 Tax=Rhodonellum sp. TaxID=2231180 RepID=UPI0027200A8A|nr:LamG domain-containing protein [Rhodonellum sp.]MDO9551877.1 LamG domain-containing protein [Rhodonellum sp.]